MILRKIYWISDKDSEISKKEIIYIFRNNLNGKAIAFQIGNFLFLYWFPPWSLGPSTRGTPNHSFESESFCFVGFISDSKNGAYLRGISFYCVVFKIVTTLLWVCGLLITSENFNDFYVGLMSYMLFSFFVFGIFKRQDEDAMNEKVRILLGLKWV